MPAKKKLIHPKKLKPIETAGKYAVSLTMNGETKTFQVNSILEALEQIKVPKVIKGKCILSVDSEGKHSEKPLHSMIMRRLSVNRFTREILQKQLAVSMK